jgi:uncharacterized YccA/Bax inhibitor family protein
MKLLENGYFLAMDTMEKRPVMDPTASQAVRTVAAVVGVVALVLGLLVLGVYAVVVLEQPLLR